MKKALLMAMAIAIAIGGCSRSPRDTKPGDYSRKTSIAQVEEMVPEDLRIAYQQLFSCSYEEETARAGHQPSLDVGFAGRTLDSVRRDPDAGRKCLAEKRKRAAS